MAKKTKKQSETDLAPIGNLPPAQGESTPSEVGPIPPAPEEVPGLNPEEPKVENVQISLAKANKVRAALQVRVSDLSSRIRSAAATQITAYPSDDLEKIKEKIEEVKSQIRAYAVEFATTSQILTNLKNQIVITNMNSGVGQTMAEIDRVSSAIQTFGSLYEKGSYSRYDEESLKYNIAVNKSVINNLPESSATLGSRTPQPFSVGVYSKADIEAELAGIASLKKAKADLEEQRNTLNYSNTVQLSKDVAMWLEERHLI